MTGRAVAILYNPQLETFLCVVDSGSFNKAAEKLFISPPAVIKQINLLEENLDLQLFVRTHRGLVLTNAGKSLYQDAKYIIQYSKDSVTRARNAMQESENIIRIGTSPMTPAQVLVDLWPKVQNYCSNTKFQLFHLRIPRKTPGRFWQIWDRILILELCHSVWAVAFAESLCCGEAISQSSGEGHQNTPLKRAAFGGKQEEFHEKDVDIAVNIVVTVSDFLSGSGFEI